MLGQVLTPSDANSGRIILPRTMVEANLHFVMGYRHGLASNLHNFVSKLTGVPALCSKPE